MTWKEAIRLRKAIAREQYNAWNLKDHSPGSGYLGLFAAIMTSYWEMVAKTGVQS